MEQLRISIHLSETEILVLKNSLISPTIRSLTDDDYHNTVVSLIEQIVLVSGARLFKGDEMRRQIESIKIFLKSSIRFNKLTRNELIHAFHMNNQGELDQVYRHYNRELNGEFIGDVLNAYLRFKLAVFRRDEQNLILDTLRKLPRPQLPAPEYKDADWKKWIQEDYLRFKAGQAEMIFNIRPKYFLLRKLGLIQFSSKRKWQEWYIRAFQQRRLQYVIRPGDSRIQIELKRLKLDMYAEIEKTGVIPADEHYSVLYTMQRLVYLQFFQLISDCAIVDVFRDIQEVYVFCRNCNSRHYYEADTCYHCKTNLHDH